MLTFRNVAIALAVWWFVFRAKPKATSGAVQVPRSDISGGAGGSW